MDTMLILHERARKSVFRFIWQLCPSFLLKSEPLIKFNDYTYTALLVMLY